MDGRTDELGKEWSQVERERERDRRRAREAHKKSCAHPRLMIIVSLLFSCSMTGRILLVDEIKLVENDEHQSDQMLNIHIAKILQFAQVLEI